MRILLKGLSLLASVSILLCSNFAFSHGGDDGERAADEKKKKLPKTKYERIAPRLPTVASIADLQMFGESKKIPADVLMVSCKISGLTLCRGIKLSLVNSIGEKLLTASTGTAGFVGFQGLDTDKVYTVAVEHERYSGSKLFQPGRLWEIIAERQ